MNKSLIIAFVSLVFCKICLAEDYYFKNCQLDQTYTGDYIIDLEKNEIKVRFIGTDGMLIQEWDDKIEIITKDKVTSGIIQSKKKAEFYNQYSLDAKSKSVIRQGYIKKHSLDILRPIGAKSQSFCKEVKADWEKVEKEKIKKKEEEMKIEKELEKIKKIEERKRLAEEKAEKEKNKKRISILGEKWIKFSEYNANSGNQLKIDFDNKASEVCLKSGFKNFDILKKKVEIVETDETPAFGLEAVIKLGISGVVKCR
tara:strand:- start:51 stop:818 length:768 start_codon:yes stop_codon:yes gene_type:complete